MASVRWGAGLEQRSLGCCVVAHACGLGACKEEAERSQVQGQPAMGIKTECQKRMRGRKEVGREGRGGEGVTMDLLYFSVH